MMKKLNIHFILYFRILLIIFFINIIFLTKKTKKNILNNYYRKRVHYLKINNIIYDKSKLITLQDKINWLSINDVNELKGNCSDKILLHEYSKKKLGKDICNKIIKIYNNPEDINFNELPEQFVLKTNHGSGFNIIVEKKENCNLKQIKSNLTNWMKIDYGEFSTEFHYSFINQFQL
jgi:hypothetical protein